MYGDDRLSWVQRNRTRRTRDQDVGSVLRAWVTKVEFGAVDPARAVAAAVAEVVDASFWDHCCVADVRGGILLVHVDEPGVLYVMRRTWEVPLTRVLGRLRMRGAPRRIRFAVGVAGVRPPVE